MHKFFPPCFFYIVFQFNTVLTIVIDGCQAIINLTTWEDEAILLAVAHNLLEYIFLCHNLL